MIAWGALAFVQPWALLALAGLPALWWLLKVMPPHPRLQRFPAIRLLAGLDAREEEPARTPPWVLLLRFALVVCLVLAAAGPLINPVRPLAGQGVLLVAVDDGWAAAADWTRRRVWLDGRLAQAERSGRPVRLLATAPPADGGPIAVSNALTGAQARAVVDALEPKPWSTDRAQAIAALATMRREEAKRMDIGAVVWMCDGIEDGHGRDFLNALQALDDGEAVVAVEGRAGHILLPAIGDADSSDPDPDRMTVGLRRAGDASGPDLVAVRALDGAGRVLGRVEVAFPPAQDLETAGFRLPLELRNRLARFDIENEDSAAAVLLLDERWRRHPVGLVAVPGGGPAAPLLDPLYYVDRALAPFADLRQETLSALLSDRPPSVLVLADTATVPASEADRLEQWIERGGVLVRFAGPTLAQAVGRGEPDRFLPVRLLGGGRTLGGVLSWTAPQKVAAFPATGPFAGLAVPDDVTVSAQVLAEPSLDLAGHTWASLDDGTPLVTAAPRGRGWMVLVHVTATPDWSTLALSGLFPEMLHRLVMLSSGQAGVAAGALAPVAVLDGFGQLHAPSGVAGAIEGAALAKETPGPRHPPGFYGTPAARVAFNLGPALGQPHALNLPDGIARVRLGAPEAERDLRPALLVAALVLGLVDLGVSLWLRGLLTRHAAGVAGGLVLAVALGAAFPARAADDAAFAMRAALDTRLAYVRTGDAQVDDKSRAGLTTLSRVVGQRSTAVLAQPMGLDIETDPILFFPLLYWPVVASQRPLSPAAAAKVDAYLHAGGLVVFDTQDGGTEGSERSRRLQDLARGLDLPPLAPVTRDHVLSRAFYLLRDMPGRYAGGTVWAAEGAEAGTDGVSPVVVGSADWAGAWAADDQGRPLYAVMPGGTRQRELAYRFGLNLVMYALTGNYKADQIHLPAILERLGR